MSDPLAEIICIITNAGTYTIWAEDWSHDETGGYQLYLERSNNPSFSTPITFGQTLTGAIAGTETDFYTFYANAGDKVIIRMKDTSTSGYLDPFISLYDPYGHWVAGDVSDPLAEIINQTITNPGTHTIWAEDWSHDETGDYQIYLVCTNCTGPPNYPPTAAFTASPTSGTAPLTVQFTDQSSNTPTSWSWNFGDGGTSSQQNPPHTYNATVSCTVSLTVSNTYGSDTETKNNYITVNPATDTVSPSAITNFTASPGSATGSVNLTWKASGDDGTTGTASSYIIRYAYEPITGSNWNGATEYSQTWVPLTAGATESHTISGTALTPGVTYYFAIKAVDEAGNVSPISNSPSAEAKSSYHGSISGKITDQANGQPLSGATVWTNPGGFSDLTNANGEYTIESLSPNTYEVWATFEGYYPNSYEVSIPIEKSGPNQTWTGINIELTHTSARINYGKVLIAAGGGEFDENGDGNCDNYIWEATDFLSRVAYTTFLGKGFTTDDIYYLHPDPSQTGVDGIISKGTIQNAILNWAASRVNSQTPFILYLVDHGLRENFMIQGPHQGSQPEYLNTTELSTWLDTLQNTTHCPIVIIYEACYSGSFIPALSDYNRVIITSTRDNEEAYLVANGQISFSNYFFQSILNGASLNNSFVSATRSVTFSFSQNPQLDDNGDGQVTREDGEVARNTYLGSISATAGLLPYIQEVSTSQNINSGTSATIWARGTENDYTVTAFIIPPGYTPPAHPTLDSPVYDLPSSSLIYNQAAERYEGTYNNFSSIGNYKVIISASDDQGNLSTPKETWVTVPPPNLNIIKITNNLTGEASVNTPVTFTVEAEEENLIYYKFWVASGYGTEDYGHWQSIQDYSPDNTCTWTPTAPGNYVVVVWATDDTTSGKILQAGISVDVRNTSSVQITGFESNIGYPQPKNQTVNLKADAVGGSGTIYYKFWVQEQGSGWISIRDYAANNTCTWTPTEEGLYTVVVWVTNDTSVSEPPIAGMTCTIGE